MKKDTETIVFGGGCFWCTEAVFAMFDGVMKTTPGYAGGDRKNPTYWDVASGNSGHAEVLEIEYDPKVAPLEKLLDIFFKMHDPTMLNRQGNDFGSEYRSLILFNSEEQKKVIDRFISKVQKEYDKPIATEIKKLERFYPAENEHKDYYKKNPLQPYCMLIIRPKVSKIKREFGLK